MLYQMSDTWADKKDAIVTMPKILQKNLIYNYNMKRMKKKVYIITLYHDFIFTIPEHFTCTKTATVINKIGCDISKKQFDP